MKAIQSHIFQIKYLIVLAILLINTNYIIIPGFTCTNDLTSIQRENNSILLSISINNNTDFSLQAGSHGWPGNGSQSDPYIIKNLFFNNSLSNQPLIQIQNTNSYFTLENISLIGGSYGILLNNVSNAIIKNVSVYKSNSNLIYLNNNENITIKDSNFSNGGNIQVNLLIDLSKDILIENNTISNSDFVGLKFRDSNSSTVIHNTIKNNKNSGIVLGHTQNILINDNTIKDNQANGISVEQSKNTNVTNNLVYNHPQPGILILANNTLISNNTVYNTLLWGLGIDVPSYNSVISHNNFIDNNNGSAMGPQVSDVSSNNTYLDNYFSEFTGPDVNNDGIVDSPYVINAEKSTIDEHPKTSVYLNSKIHILTKPNFIPFSGTSPYSDLLNITWGIASDTFNHLITYSVYIRTNDTPTWQMLADNISSTIYQLNTTKLMNYDMYLLKIVSNDNQGSINFRISDFFGIYNDQSSETSQITDTNGNTNTENTNSGNTNSKTADFGFTIYTVLGLLILTGLLFSKKNRPNKEK